MQIRRMGKLFDPRDYASIEGSVGYAQSPQALVLEDRLRIYFSTRVVDDSGKFVSHVAYVDLSKDLREVLGVSQHEVISQGELGCFDEHGIFPFHVMAVDDLVYAYTNGWSRRASVSVETGIGLAVSRDSGETFHRLGPGPIVTASLNEPFLVGDAFVRRYQSMFNMWYIFGKEWKCLPTDPTPERIYKIAHATSGDGINWNIGHGRQLIPDVLGPDESQALPTVIKQSGTYHMFFCFRESFNFRAGEGRGYRLGYATSEDLVSWQRRDEELKFQEPFEEWDSEMQCYPHVFVSDQRVFLLYNGNQFGRCGFGALELTL